MPNLTRDAGILSRTIDLLRFPLAIGVVFIHMTPATVAPYESTLPILSADGIVNIVKVIFSHALPSVSVPTFFFISGLLFFMNFREWDWRVYKGKLGKRIRSLLVPYLLWCVIAFLPILCLNIASVIYHGLTIDSLAPFIREYLSGMFWNLRDLSSYTNFLGWTFPNGAPIIIPLWFVRDLMVVILFTPAVYWAVSRGGLFTLLILFACDLMKLWIPLDGFSSGAFLWFSAGAYFSIHKVNLIELLRRYSKLIVILGLVSFAGMIIVDGWYSEVGTFVAPVMMPGCIALTVGASAYFVERHNAAVNKELVAACFFVYALHQFDLPYSGPIIHFTKVMFNSALNAEGSAIGAILAYLMAPVITVVLCLIIYRGCKRFFPKMTSILSGSR